jgi:hypothetical protein
MSDKTVLVLPGRKMSVQRPVKRTLQVVLAMALTSLATLIIVVSNGFLTARGRSFHGFDVWLAFMRRSDILATMALTAIVTVLFVYWQRGQERK